MKSCMLLSCPHLSLKLCDSMIDESKKRMSFPSIPRIIQIQVGRKGRIDIMKSLKEKCMSLEDKKNATFF